MIFFFFQTTPRLSSAKIMNREFTTKLETGEGNNSDKKCLDSFRCFGIVLGICISNFGYFLKVKWRLNFLWKEVEQSWRLYTVLSKWWVNRMWTKVTDGVGWGLVLSFCLFYSKSIFPLLCTSCKHKLLLFKASFPQGYRQKRKFLLK